jgi:transcriptional regulator with XRE-family HTH domain
MVIMGRHGADFRVFANVWAQCYFTRMPDKESSILGSNVRTLREARGMTQAQMAKLAKLPRATWANLETGTSNPTLSVLLRVSQSLGVSFEELLRPQGSLGKKYPRGTLPVRHRGDVRVEKLLPDPLPAMDIDRMTVPPGSKMIGVPHTQGTQEYFICEVGTVRLITAGETFEVGPGDVVSFRGDQRHSYESAWPKDSVAYSVVVLAKGLR